MKKVGTGTLLILVGLFLGNFSLQTFNILRLSTCDFYHFHPECSSGFEAAVNKLTRLLFNLLALYLLQIRAQQKLLPLGLVGFGLICTYFFLFFSQAAWSDAGIRVLNPLLFSPLIPLALLASTYFQKEN